MKNTSNQTDNPKYTKAKRIAALACVILLVALYLFTLVISILDRTGSGKLFQACLFATVAIPLLTWIYIWCYGALLRKHTIASLDILHVEDEVASDDNTTKEEKSENK